MNEYSKYLVLKSTLEDLFGSEAWYALKESNSPHVWKKYGVKTLDAIELSISDTIKIRDDDWMKEIEALIEEGKQDIKRQKSIDEVISALAGTLIRVSFLQIGLMPSRKGSSHKYTLRKGQWRLDRFRSAVYLQTPEQREDLFISRQQAKIGFQAQQVLRDEHHHSKTQLSYEQWCLEREDA